MLECPECGRLFPDEEASCQHDGQVLAIPGEADPYLGRIVGSYTLTRQLGKGGMGAVYLGRHGQIGSQVAIKILASKFATNTDIVDRFFNEARAANLIGHENIIHIFDFGQLADRTPYYVMELLNGEPLAAWTSEPVALERVAPVALQIADALQAAHDAGIIHRDLKPENIFLVPRSQGVQVKILDFGISKLSMDDGATASHVVMGTARYMSPEQAIGDTSKVVPQSDIYSLGVILYQLASGRAPFVEPSFAQTLTAHIERKPPPLPAAVPKAYAGLILRCLEKQAADRFGSMRELRAAIASLAEPPPQLAKRARRWPILAALGGVGVAAAGGLVAASHWVASSPPRVVPSVVAEPVRTPLVPIVEPAPVQPPLAPPKGHKSKPPDPVDPKYSYIRRELGDDFIDVTYNQ